MLHGTADTVAPFSDSCELTKRLELSNVPVKLIEVGGADHGLGPQNVYVKYFDIIVEALEEYFGR